MTCALLKKIHCEGFKGTKRLAKETPDYEHAHPLPSAVPNAIYVVFEALHDEDLL